MSKLNFFPSVAETVSSGSIVMGFLHRQDGLMRTGFETAQTAPTVIRLVNGNMVVEWEIHLSENVLWTDLHTCPTGLAATGIQADITGLYMMVKLHFLFL
jgi:hypothetical protein